MRVRVVALQSAAAVPLSKELRVCVLELGCFEAWVEVPLQGATAVCALGSLGAGA